MFKTIAWTDGGVVMLDQRLLPEQEVYLTLTRPEEVAEAIRSMAIRGAPAIGVAAAMGLALGARRFAEAGAHDSGQGLVALYNLFAATRPTARNLFGAIDRMKAAAGSVAGSSPAVVAKRLLDEALSIEA